MMQTPLPRCPAADWVQLADTLRLSICVSSGEGVAITLISCLLPLVILINLFYNMVISHNLINLSNVSNILRILYGRTHM